MRWAAEPWAPSWNQGSSGGVGDGEEAGPQFVEVADVGAGEAVGLEFLLDGELVVDAEALLDGVAVGGVLGGDRLGAAHDLAVEVVGHDPRHRAKPTMRELQ